MLQKEFFRAQSYNPDLPEETWMLVFEKDTSGAYSQSLGWGKYKVVFSGGGGSGGVIAYSRTEIISSSFAHNGSNAEEKTIYFSVSVDDTKTLSGIIGSGAAGSGARGRRNVFSPSPQASSGAAGVGYQNGSKGGAKTTYYEYPGTPHTYSEFGAAGGSGGGSTSVSIDNSTPETARGGNGGSARLDLTAYNAGQIGTVNGGVGGNGGVASGSGASGGEGAQKYDGATTSSAGADGYVRIYKSNIKPNAN